MKRDMDLIRDILLEIESASDRNIVRRQKAVSIEGVPEAVILDHINLLQNAGVLTPFMNQFGKTQVDSLSISWMGYEFLDTIRDEEVWRKTKQVTKAAGGWSFELLQDTAKNIISTSISAVLLQGVA